MWKIKFSDKLYTELQVYLFDNSPDENGCFLLGNQSGNAIFVTDILYPESSNMISCGTAECSPSAAYISRAVQEADNRSKALLFVHSHPGPNLPATFSEIDEISNDKLFHNLSAITSQPIGSLVISPHGLHGIICCNSLLSRIESYTVFGQNQIRFYLDVIKSSKEWDEELYDRQLKFMNDDCRKSISAMKVAVVGLGGIGSPLVTMLAKMGVMHLELFDNDIVERHNLPRLLGAYEEDIGKFKVDVAKTYIETFSKADIITHNEMVDNNTDLSGFDIIFGCLDNHTARDILNRIAYTHSIPYIDSACSIPIDSTGKIAQAVTTVNVVMPGQPCLWCTDVLNGLNLNAESLNESEKAIQEKDGYLSTVEEVPSVISLTTSVASMAVNRFLNIIGVLSGVYPVKMMFDFDKSLFYEPTVEIKSTCICQKTDPFHS